MFFWESIYIRVETIEVVDLSSGKVDIPDVKPNKQGWPIYVSTNVPHTLNVYFDNEADRQAAAKVLADEVDRVSNLGVYKKKKRVPLVGPIGSNQSISGTETANVKSAHHVSLRSRE